MTDGRDLGVRMRVVFIDGAAAVAAPDRDNLDFIGRAQFLQQEDHAGRAGFRRVIECDHAAKVKCGCG